MELNNASTNLKPINYTIITENNTNFKVFYYEGIRLIQHINSGYYNIAKICSDNGKELSNITKNKHYKLLLDEISRVRQIGRTKLTFELRDGFAGEVTGTYAHEMIMEHVLHRVSIEYNVKVLNLMSLIRNEILLRNELNKNKLISLENIIENKENEITSLQKQLSSKDKIISTQREQCVPFDRRKDYSYLIYTTDDLEDTSLQAIHLKVVCRNKQSIRHELHDIINSKQCLLYMQNLPISKSFNKNIKQLLLSTYKQGIQYEHITCYNFIINKPYLQEILIFIENYILTYQ